MGFNKGSFLGMTQFFDFGFPFLGAASILKFFNVDEFHRVIHAGVFCALTCVVLLDAPCQVGGPSRIKRTVGTFNDIAEKWHI